MLPPSPVTDLMRLKQKVLAASRRSDSGIRTPPVLERHVILPVLVDKLVRFVVLRSTLLQDSQAAAVARSAFAQLHLVRQLPLSLSRGGGRGGCGAASRELSLRRRRVGPRDPHSGFHSTLASGGSAAITA